MKIAKEIAGKRLHYFWYLFIWYLYGTFNFQWRHVL